MSPRAGGEADKFGNRYEGEWAVHYLLYVLFGKEDSVTVEPIGATGDGVEFTVNRGSFTEAHQVKRQHGTATGWTITSLNTEGVLAAAQHHVEAGRNFHFVSTIPSPILGELCDRARRTDRSL